MKSLVSRVDFREVSRLESNLAEYLGAKRVLALDSGRSALALALRLFKLKAGERVLLPAFVCPVVYDVVASMGCKPVPVDVSLETSNIEANKMDETCSENPRLIIPVHLFGKSCDMDRIAKFSEYHHLSVIEDAAQALGGEYKGIKMGSLGDVSILSFGLGKIITGGGGGALVINRSELVQDVKNILEEMVVPTPKSRARVTGNILAMKFLASPRLYPMIRNHLDNSLEETDCRMVEHVKKSLVRPREASYRPSRIHPLSAEVVNHQLRRLPEFNRKRIRNATILSEILMSQSKVHVPSREYFRNNVFCRFAIKLSKDSSHKRDQIARRLSKLGIDTEKPYHVLKTFLQSFKNIPNSNELVDTLITIPNHPCLSDDEVGRVGQSALSILRSEL